MFFTLPRNHMTIQNKRAQACYFNISLKLIP